MKSIRSKLLSLMLILALAFGMAGAINVDTTYAASKKIHLKKTTISVNAGKTYQQKLIDKSGKKIKASKIKWKSLKTSVAKINKKGKITAVKKGTARMTARYKGKTYKFTVKVKIGNYSNDDVLTLLQQAGNAVDWTEYVTDEVELWGYDSYSAYSSYLADIRSDLSNASAWLAEARKITKNRKTRYCKSDYAYERGFSTWDGMLKETIDKCNTIQTADVENMSSAERMELSMVILEVVIDINSAYLELSE